MIKIQDLKIFKQEPKAGVNNEYKVLNNEFRQPCLWMIAGVRFSGKSYLVSKFLRQAQGGNRKHKTLSHYFDHLTPYPEAQPQ